MKRTITVAAIAALIAGMAATAGGPAAATPPGSSVAASQPTPVDPASTALVRLELSRAEFDRLAASGADIAAGPRASGTRVVADLVLRGDEVQRLEARGGKLLQVIEQEGDGSRRYAASQRAAQAKAAKGLSPVSPRQAAVEAAGEDTLHVEQAYWWTSGDRIFLQVAAATTATDDPDVELTVTWTAADGSTGSFPLLRFEDAGEYQYHVADPVLVPAQPTLITVTSSLGGTTSATPRRWPGAGVPPQPAGYQSDFIDAYMSPLQVRARIHRLARQYPDLVDVIDLPNRTQGYRRTAAAYVGDRTVAAIVVESVRFGSQGWNGVLVQTVDPGRANRPLSARYRDRVLTISLATGPDGAIISTTDEVAAFVSAKWPNRFNAFVENGSSGQLMPVASARLDDGLSGEGSVPTRPWTVQALRIGMHRDGSRIGVLAYSQEHAREWATPLVTLEFAEQLLRNASTDPGTQQLLEDVDVFVIPTVNPDGANYSFNDFNFQRKNMTNYCAGSLRDPAYRNSWGVDLNRNHSVGSVFDGYAGASATNCLSGVFAGPAELSEPEADNIVDLAAAHPNIRFAMNVHSYGGYFMWPPGAYKAEGRITLPRPSIDEAHEFLTAARRIVAAIASVRGTVTWSSKVGPVVDVLYSAAGNSADQLYYVNGIYAWDFEVGNDVWNPDTAQWEGVGFQPPYAEAHGEALEYAAGLVELVRVARDAAASGELAQAG